MRTLFTATVIAAVSCTLIALGAAFDAPKPQEARPEKTSAAPSLAEMGPKMMAALKATPGCLGVDAGQTLSGKHVIYAWFEDKRAVQAWLDSPAHKAAKRAFFPDEVPGEYVPLQGIPDDAGPLLAIAAVSSPAVAEGQPRRPAFSIELYTPVTPGLRTSPEAGFSPQEVQRLFNDRKAAKNPTPVRGG